MRPRWGKSRVLLHSLRLDRANEAAPEVRALALTDLEAKVFRVADGIDAHADNDCFGANLYRSDESAVHVCGIELKVGVAVGLQSPR